MRWLYFPPVFKKAYHKLLQAVSLLVHQSQTWPLCGYLEELLGQHKSHPLLNTGSITFEALSLASVSLDSSAEVVTEPLFVLELLAPLSTA